MLKAASGGLLTGIYTFVTIYRFERSANSVGMDLPGRKAIPVGPYIGMVSKELLLRIQLLVAVQPTRGLDVGAIEYIHTQIVKTRDSGAGVLLVSLELEEVMSLSDRILVMYEGEIVGEFDPKTTTVQELGLYMAGAKRQEREEAAE
jgi:hypothetical protein